MTTPTAAFLEAPDSSSRPAAVEAGAGSGQEGAARMPRVPLDFQAHSEALRDLRRLPSWVQHSTRLALQQLVLVHHRGPLVAERRLGVEQQCREVHLGPGGKWRAIYQERPSAADGDAQQVYLLAVGTRADSAVLASAAQRLGLASSDREDAFLARSALAPIPGETAEAEAKRSTPASRPARHH